MPASRPANAPVDVEARCVRLNAKADDVASLPPVVERRTLSRVDGEVLVEIRAAAVNPSDVKAATGLMPYAVFPRTPGRDYAGVVIDGPQALIGREVFGSSGDLGIRRDGTHATHLVVEADAVVEKPTTISWEEAAGIGVPFVTAMEGLRRAGIPQAGETVLVMGVNGKVGQAAVQIASWHGARVIGVVRKAEAYEGHANSDVEVIDASSADVAARVRELTGGHGADIVFNTVGDLSAGGCQTRVRRGGRLVARPRHFAAGGRSLTNPLRHCEERSDAAIQLFRDAPGLLRFARNDGFNRYGRRMTRSRDDPATATNARLASSSG